jgi:propionyl-CoA synthetase
MRHEDGYRRSVEAPEAFRAEQAKAIHRHVPPHTILQYDAPPFRAWFVGGETNLCFNAVDRHLDARGGGLDPAQRSLQRDHRPRVKARTSA